MNSREYWRPQVHQRNSEETISLFPSLPSAPLSHAFSSYIHTLTLLNCIFSMCIVHTLYWETHQMHTYFMHTQSYTFSPDALCTRIRSMYLLVPFASEYLSTHWRDHLLHLFPEIIPGVFIGRVVTIIEDTLVQFKPFFLKKSFFCQSSQSSHHLLPTDWLDRLQICALSLSLFLTL